MFPPCQAMVRYFLPAFRVLVAKELVRKGVSQGRAARLLGVTQAAVSQYLRKDEGYAFDRLSQFNLRREDAILYSSLIAEELQRSPVEALYTFYGLWRSLLARGDVCVIHRALSPQLAACDMCMKTLGPTMPTLDRERVLVEVREAVAMLEGYTPFSAVVPNVGVNLVACGESPRTISDVVGIPGRIVKLKGGVRASSPPEFGASHHMASILLEAHRVDPTVKSCINTKFDPRVLRALENLGWRFTYTVPKDSLKPIDGDIVLAAVRETLSRLGSVGDALIDEGGVGLEPITYIFAGSPREAVLKAIALARAYLEAG